LDHGLELVGIGRNDWLNCLRGAHSPKIRRCEAHIVSRFIAKILNSGAFKHHTRASSELDASVSRGIPAVDRSPRDADRCGVQTGETGDVGSEIQTPAEKYASIRRERERGVSRDVRCAEAECDDIIGIGTPSGFIKALNL